MAEEQKASEEKVSKNEVVINRAIAQLSGVSNILSQCLAALELNDRLGQANLALAARVKELEEKLGLESTLKSDAPVAAETVQ